uniref:PGG domain-containing protein n=1 Tax=Plectus sambesii TaxID=2011161 RepID=A0A914X1J1_9BILA
MEVWGGATLDALAHDGEQRKFHQFLKNMSAVFNSLAIFLTVIGFLFACNNIPRNDPIHHNQSWQRRPVPLSRQLNGFSQLVEAHSDWFRPLHRDGKLLCCLAVQLQVRSAPILDVIWLWLKGWYIAAGDAICHDSHRRTPRKFFSNIAMVCNTLATILTILGFALASFMGCHRVVAVGMV